MTQHMFKKIKSFCNDLKDRKENRELRYLIETFLKTRNLRAVSFYNWYVWHTGDEPDHADMPIHSVKVNPKDGQIMFCGYKTNGTDMTRSGKPIDKVQTPVLRNVFDGIGRILDEEKQIPLKVRKNILVLQTR